MTTLEIISEYAERAHLPFMLVGGLAVATYISGRQTGDIDLAAQEIDRPKWDELLAGLKYQIFFQHKSFSQFRPPDLGYAPLDIMFLSEPTFNGLLSESKDIHVGGRHQVKVPSAKHLIAMKLHALREPTREDTVSDLRDIVELAGHLGIDLLSEDFKTLCFKYGNEAIYGKLKALAI